MAVIPEQATWLRLPRFVGDAAMQLPVLRLLRQIGVGPLVVWGPKGAVSLLENTWFCDAALADQGKPSPLAMARTLREHRAARSIHFPKSLRPALAAWLARVPERIGVDESLAGPFNTHSGPFWDAEGPFLLRYHAVLQRRWPDLPPMPFADFDPGVTVDRPAAPYLCLMPGSTWPSKAWPIAHYRTLLLRARTEGFQVAVLGSPDEAATCAAVAGAEGIDLCGRTTLKEAAAWLRGAAAVLGTTPASATWPPPAGHRSWRSTEPQIPAGRRPGAPAAEASGRRASPAPPASSPPAPSRATPAWRASSLFRSGMPCNP